jgi:hypothetical protein
MNCARVHHHHEHGSTICRSCRRRSPCRDQTDGDRVVFRIKRTDYCHMIPNPEFIFGGTSSRISTLARWFCRSKRSVWTPVRGDAVWPTFQYPQTNQVVSVLFPGTRECPYDRY